MTDHIDTLEAGEGCPLGAHFDHSGPEVTQDPHAALAHLRAFHPVPHSDQHGGFWTVTRYEDVLRVAQDWESFSSEHGITIPGGPTGTLQAIPETIDPPLHRVYKRLINAYFTPAMVGTEEQATRVIVNTLIDAFIDDGACDFVAAFARPLPGLVFFERFLHAPAEDLDEINRLASLASVPNTREAIDARMAMLGWIGEFANRRRLEPPRGDVVDAVLQADIDGRPITDVEVVGILQLLLFGGLDTTAGALGMMMIRLCRQPEIQDLLRSDHELMTNAVEELLRLDAPFAFIGRTAMRDTEVAGCPIQQGDRMLISWISANRDETEFPDPDVFDLHRDSNRHVTFGAGPHRCAGSNLARMNIRIALTELLRRLDDIRLADPSGSDDGAAEPIAFHGIYSRGPAAVPITFRAAG